MVEEGGRGAEEDGDERERREWLHGQQHDSWEVREREASQWPPI